LSAGYATARQAFPCRHGRTGVQPWGNGLRPGARHHQGRHPPFALRHHGDQRDHAEGRHAHVDRGAEQEGRPAKPRRGALCPSAAPAPRRAGPPSHRPIRPKRAAISRLFAQNVKRDARLENREIAGVLERGAGLKIAQPRLLTFAILSNTAFLPPIVTSREDHRSPRSDPGSPAPASGGPQEKSSVVRCSACAPGIWWIKAQERAQYHSPIEHRIT
jgi:hypothetical protein